MGVGGSSKLIVHSVFLQLKRLAGFLRFSFFTVWGFISGIWKGVFALLAVCSGLLRLLVSSGSNGFSETTEFTRQVSELV